MRTTLSTAVLVATLAAGAAGCGSAMQTASDTTPGPPSTSASPTGSGTPSSSPTIRPATGHTLHTAGFTVTVPTGWSDVTAQAPAGVRLYAAKLSDDDNPSMLVVRFEPGLRPAAAARRALHAGQVSPPSPAGTVTVNGRDFSHVTARSTAKGDHQRYDAFGTAGHGGSWALVFDMSAWAVADARDSTQQSVLATASLG